MQRQLMLRRLVGAIAIVALLLVFVGTQDRGAVSAAWAETPGLTTSFQATENEGASEVLEAENSEAVINQSLGISNNAVDVYVLRCNTTVAGQAARAAVVDLGGVDGRRFYVHLTRQATGRTAKATAADGGLSGTATVATGGAGSLHFVVVGKDRAGSLLTPSEAYRVGADCIAGGIVRSHSLFLIQNQ
jgi:hypothetical protein